DFERIVLIGIEPSENGDLFERELFRRHLAVAVDIQALEDLIDAISVGGERGQDQDPRRERSRRGQATHTDTFHGLLAPMTIHHGEDRRSRYVRQHTAQRLVLLASCLLTITAVPNSSASVVMNRQAKHAQISTPQQAALQGSKVAV